MSKYNKTILTDAGLELAKKANAGKAKFEITRAVTSSEDLSGKTITELQALTELPSLMQSGTILDAEPTQTDNAILGVSLRFTNKDLTNSYPIRNVGLYVKEEGKDQDFLYALATAQEAEFMPDYSDQVLYRFNLQMYVVVGRVQSVTVEILDGTSVPYDAFNRHVKESNARFEDLERTRVKSATVNGSEKVLPDNEGNLALTVPDPDLSGLAAKEEVYAKTETYNKGEINSLIDNAGKVKSATVNGGTKILPTEDGTLPLVVPDPDLSGLATKEDLANVGKVKTVDGNQPDASGNVNTNSVKKVNDTAPDSSGNVTLPDQHVYLSETEYAELSNAERNNGKIYMIEEE